WASGWRARSTATTAMSASERSAPGISIVIPFHNERGNLELLLPRLITVLNQVDDRPAEVLLVDDASTDGSAQVAEALVAGDSRFRVIRLEQRGGQTGAFKRAFAEARHDYIVRMDADLQDQPEDLPLFFAKIDGGADLIMG